MSQLSDAAKLWEDEYEWPVLRGRRARKLADPGQHGRKPPPRLSARDKLRLIVKRAPEVMVKISGNGKDAAHIGAHMGYIGRHGDLELEDQEGNLYRATNEVSDLQEAWAKGRYGLPQEDGTRKESYNIVLSMPAGTNYRGLQAAVRAFAAEEFAERQYAFVIHDDKDHAHAHLVVKSVDAKGRRLNPRKADLRRWREHFAVRLREQGIEANATSRAARGVVKKPEKQALRGIQGRGERPRRADQQENEARAEARGTWTNNDAAAAQIAIEASRKKLIQVYGGMARNLAKGDAGDKALARDITAFVEQLPRATTQHAQRVERYRSGAGVAVERQPRLDQAERERR